MNENKIMKNDWYAKLLTDLKKLEFTGIVLTKWNIGKRILEDFEKFGKPEYGSKRIENSRKGYNADTVCQIFGKSKIQDSLGEDKKWMKIKL